METNRENTYTDLIKYFMDNFPLDLIIKDITPRDNLEKIAVELLNRIIDIQTIFNRLNKYPIFFERFYVSQIEDISEADALEYHIHSYLNDFYSLEEKIERLLNFMNNKLKEFNIINPMDVKNLIKHLNTQTKKGLNQVHGVRGEHVHNKSVRDLEVVQARTILQVLNSSDIDVSEKELLRQRYDTLIKTAKEKYIKQSNSNNIELNKFMNFLACRIGHIIASLYGHDATRFIEVIKKEKDVY